MIPKINLKFFKQYGFLIIRDLVSKSEIKKCLKSTKKMQKKGISDNNVSKYYEQSIIRKDKEVLVRIENFYKKNKDLTSLINNKKIFEILKNIFHDKPIIFKEKINYKLPGCRQDKLHQDSQAGWGKYCKNFVSVLISLEYSNLNNGCLQFDVSGNNSKKLINKSMKPLQVKNLKKPKFKSFIMFPGDVIFFNSFIPHKSNFNKSTKSRIQVYLTYNKISDGNFRKRYIKEKEIFYPPNNKRSKDISYSYKV